jgi:hypothetical protein
MSDKVNCFVKENHQVVDASHVIACGGIAKGNGNWYASHFANGQDVTGYGKTPKEAEDNCVSLINQ